MYGPPSTSYGGRGGRDDGGGSRGGGGGRDGGFPRGGGGGGRRSPSPESRGYRGGRPPIDEGWSRAAPAPASHSFERDAYGGSDSYRGRPSRGGGARGGRSDRGFGTFPLLLRRSFASLLIRMARDHTLHTSSFASIFLASIRRVVSANEVRSAGAGKKNSRREERLERKAAKKRVRPSGNQRSPAHIIVSRMHENWHECVRRKRNE